MTAIGGEATRRVGRPWRFASASTEQTRNARDASATRITRVVPVSPFNSEPPPNLRHESHCMPSAASATKG